MRISFYLLFVVAIQGYAQKPASTKTIDYGNNAAVGKFVNNKGVKVYYETYGKGKPLVFIHGNGGSIQGRASFIEHFSKTYKVIVMDNRCHGKTDCPEGPLTYEQMADDLNVLLQSQKIDSSFIWGHSDGGIVGLLMAIHYPDKVKKLLASGANLRPDTTAVDPRIMPVLGKLYELSKNDTVKLKQYKLLAFQPNIPVSDLHKIKCDVLIMAGDRDVIRNEHTLEIFNNIPGALLCILPGTTHFVSSQRKDWFMEIFTNFLTTPPSRTTTAELMSQSFK
jgi:pimeloyl-ACP methyl ester carboxylesterase